MLQGLLSHKDPADWMDEEEYRQNERISFFRKGRI
jgi:hypothetical protein